MALDSPGLGNLDPRSQTLSPGLSLQGQTSREQKAQSMCLGSVARWALLPASRSLRRPVSCVPLLATIGQREPSEFLWSLYKANSLGTQQVRQWPFCFCISGPQATNPETTLVPFGGRQV